MLKIYWGYPATISATLFATFGIFGFYLGLYCGGVIALICAVQAIGGQLNFRYKIGKIYLIPSTFVLLFCVMLFAMPRGNYDNLFDAWMVVMLLPIPVFARHETAPPIEN